MAEILQDEITELDFPENVRTRKEMYLNSSNHCIYEILDNSVDEFNAGHAKEIRLNVAKIEGSAFEQITVWDDGRGIPTRLSSDAKHRGETQAEVALGNLTAGGKFGKKGGYQTVTSGLHGVGASCVNATSSVFTANIYHGGTRTTLKYEEGLLKEKVVEAKIEDKAIHGTEIAFVLDSKLWNDENDSFDLKDIRKRMRELSYLNPGLKLVFQDETGAEEYFHEDGILGYFEEHTQGKLLLEEKPVSIHRKVKYDGDKDVEVWLVFGYGQDDNKKGSKGFVNNVATESGDHLAGFAQGINQAIRKFLEQSDKNKTLVKNMNGEDTKEGLYAILSIKLMDPKFEGQAKTSIKMSKVRSAISKLVFEEYMLYLDQHPSFVKLLTDKLEKAYNARKAAEAARNRVRGESSSMENSLPGKLAACSSKKPEECSIYIVEGDSAAGSAIQGRDSRTQAILPVFGKILNTERAKTDEVYNNSKLQDVVKALRCGIGKKFDISKLRYHKIIIMADADVDGYHISTLWITFFYRHMPQLIENGHIYIQLSPLYRITEIVGKKEVNHYCFDDEELAEFEAKNKGKKYHKSYIKGLGELQPKQLWESTMDPANRRLIRVTAKDAEKADEAVAMCMGEDVDERKKFILSKADFGKAVD